MGALLEDAWSSLYLPLRGTAAREGKLRPRVLVSGGYGWRLFGDGPVTPGETPGELHCLRPGKNVLVQLLSTRSLAEAVVDSLPRASLQELLETSYRASYWRSVRDIYRGWQRDEGPPPSQRRRALTELQQARVTFQPSPDEDGVVRSPWWPLGPRSLSSS